MKERSIRAIFDQDTITVYQAYRPAIAILAVENQRFIPPFKLDRMTWIKPSFLWMMYRCGWGTKEGQEHILAIKIKREGWEWAIKHACLSHYIQSAHSSHEAWKETLKNAPVRIQWDPERDIHLQKLPYRSIQVGLMSDAIEKYVNDWIVSIEDISTRCAHIHSLVLKNKKEEAASLLPPEVIYPLPDDLKSPIMHSI